MLFVLNVDGAINFKMMSRAGSITHIFGEALYSYFSYFLHFIRFLFSRISKLLWKSNSVNILHLYSCSCVHICARNIHDSLCCVVYVKSCNPTCSHLYY